MVGFKTQNGSVFIVDQKRKTISGKITDNKQQSYVSLSAVIGFPAIIKLSNGSVIRTSAVTCYL